MSTAAHEAHDALDAPRASPNPPAPAPAAAPRTRTRVPSIVGAPATPVAATPAVPAARIAPAGRTAAGAMPATPSGRMSLAKVVRGKLAKPLRVLIYGIEGVGKSSFAAGAPDPIFIGAEDGTSELDVARFPEPSGFADALEAAAELTSAPHQYKTLVIDTLDWLEPMVWAHTCAVKRDKFGKPFPDIEAFGYGKGYAAALDYWRQLTAVLERMRAARDMHVVLVAHTWIKPFKNPAGEDFDRFEMKLHARAAGLMREWCDAVLFATHETHTYESGGRTKGISSGARVIHTERCAAFDAKNRYDLPDTLPLDWGSFAEAVAAHRPADPSQLIARIARMLELVPAAHPLHARVQSAMAAAAEDAAELARIANKLSTTVDALITTPSPNPEEE